VTERQLQQAVIEMARMLGWMVAHFRPAQTAKGWRTAVEGDGAGFPDLTLVRGPRLLFVELKRAGGSTAPAQQKWLHALQQTAAEVHVWKPADWTDGTIEQQLRQP
jgi:hypothetical protein